MSSRGVSLAELAREALANLRGQGRRSLLALLGIVIGSSAIVALMNIAHIAQSEAMKSFRQTGVDVLSVRLEGVNPAGLDPKGQNIYAETAASGTPNTGTAGLNGLGTLQQGFVETSNVNVVEELVGMIQTQRAYELNSKAIKTSDDMLARLTQL